MFVRKFEETSGKTSMQMEEYIHIHTYTHISFRRSTNSVIQQLDIKLVRKNT